MSWKAWTGHLPCWIHTRHKVCMGHSFTRVPPIFIIIIGHQWDMAHAKKERNKKGKKKFVTLHPHSPFLVFLMLLQFLPQCLFIIHNFFSHFLFQNLSLYF